MKCVSIEPVINGIRYYLLFEITEQKGERWSITYYTLDQDRQANLLSDFLPDKVQIANREKWNKVYHTIANETFIDPRVHTIEGRVLCQIFYMHILEAISRQPEPARKPGWGDRFKDKTAGIPPIIPESNRH